jgi:hypothetical protein
LAHLASAARLASSWLGSTRVVTWPSGLSRVAAQPAGAAAWPNPLAGRRGRSAHFWPVSLVAQPAAYKRAAVRVGNPNRLLPQTAAQPGVAAGAAAGSTANPTAFSSSVAADRLPLRRSAPPPVASAARSWVPAQIWDGAATAPRTSVAIDEAGPAAPPPAPVAAQVEGASRLPPKGEAESHPVLRCEHRPESRSPGFHASERRRV